MNEDGCFVERRRFFFRRNNALFGIVSQCTCLIAMLTLPIKYDVTLGTLSHRLRSACATHCRLYEVFLSLWPKTLYQLLCRHLATCCCLAACRHLTTSRHIAAGCQLVVWRHLLPVVAEKNTDKFIPNGNQINLGHSASYQFLIINNYYVHVEFNCGQFT